MKLLSILAALVTAAPALAAPAASAGQAHEGAHAKKGEHADAPRSFDSRPPEGTWARCPVSGDVFRVTKDTQFSTYNGRTYAFCCEDCKPDFDKNPAKFAPKS